MSFLKNLFKEAGVKDVITLFHAPKSQASIRAHTILKQAAGSAHSHATEDQASSHDKQSKLERTNFELDVQETAPTSDQLSNILEWLGPSKAGTVIEGASGSSDALRKFKSSETLFRPPVIVDWNNGRAIVGDNESDILKLIQSLPKNERKS